MADSNRGKRLGSLIPAVWLVLAGILTPLGGTKSAPEAPPLPDSAQLVVHFDIDRLRDSELYHQVAEQVKVFARSEEQLQMFLQATGLDAAADSLKSFTIYSFVDENHPAEFAGVVEGDFPPETMSRLQRAYAPVAREVAGRVIMPVIQTPDMELVMAFLGSGRLSFGTVGAVTRVVDSGKMSRNLALAYDKTETRRPVWGLVDAQGTINTALRMGEQSGEAEFLRTLQESPALNALTAIGFSVDIGRDIFFEMRALTSDAENARLLADAVKGMLALSQMGVSQARDPDLHEFFRQIVAENEGDSVYVSFSVGPAQIERLRALGEPLEDLIP